MLTINDKHIILGSIGGGGGSAPVLPDGWDSSWLAPPTVVDNGDGTGTINGDSNAAYLLATIRAGTPQQVRIGAQVAYNITLLDAIDGNVVGAYSNSAGTTTIFSPDFSIASATSQQLDGTRQLWIKVTPQSGNLTGLLANTALSGYQNARSEIIAALVSGADGTYEFSNIAALKFLKLLPKTALPPTASTNVSNVRYSVTLVDASVISHAFNYAMRDVDITFPAATSINALMLSNNRLLSAKITAPLATNSNPTIFIDASGTVSSANNNLRSVIMPGFRCGFSVRYSAMTATALDAMFASLGTAHTTGQIIDVRNNPGLLTCDVSIAVMKGYTVLTA